MEKTYLERLKEVEKLYRSIVELMESLIDDRDVILSTEDIPGVIDPLKEILREAEGNTLKTYKAQLEKIHRKIQELEQRKGI